MRITIDSTDKLVVLSVDGHQVPARIWEGTTAAGVPVICMVTRVAVKRDADTSQFEAELAAQRPPSAEARAWPARMVL